MSNKENEALIELRNSFADFLETEKTFYQIIIDCLSFRLEDQATQVAERSIKRLREQSEKLRI